MPSVDVPATHPFATSSSTLTAVAASVGTPAYVYDAGTIRAAYRELDEALAEWPHGLHYALKANSSLSIARLLRELGCGADANSGGEIEVALRAGFLPAQIVFTGVGKTMAELERAVSLSVGVINAESAGELQRIASIAQMQQTTARVALRVNPDIDARSHPHISTGLRTNKFGVPIEDARAMYREAARVPGLEPVGLHIHVGSQITTLEPLARAADKVLDLVHQLKDDGIPLDHVDLGGGLGISYDGTPVPGLGDYARIMSDRIGPTGLRLLL